MNSLPYFTMNSWEIPSTCQSWLTSFGFRLWMFIRTWSLINIVGRIPCLHEIVFRISYNLSSFLSTVAFFVTFTPMSLLRRALIGSSSAISPSFFATHITKLEPLLTRFSIFFVIRISISSVIQILERDWNRGSFFIISTVFTIP